MGATNIEIKLPKAKYPTRSSVQIWYTNAVQQATREYGTDCYNGTISTTRGITFEEGTAFSDYGTAVNYTCDRTKKWGPVLAVTLTEKGKDFWFIGGWAAE